MNLDGPSNKIKIDDNIHEKAIIGMYNIGAMCETIEQMHLKMIELETKINELGCGKKA